MRQLSVLKLLINLDTFNNDIASMSMDAIQGGPVTLITVVSRLNSLPVRIPTGWKFVLRFRNVVREINFEKLWQKL